MSVTLKINEWIRLAKKGTKKNFETSIDQLRFSNPWAASILRCPRLKIKGVVADPKIEVIRL
jgi:hypothetical protein